MATHIGQMATELARSNPWWRTADWARIDIDLQPVEDRALGYRSGCLEDIEPGGLYLLRGPRRVGKTVAIKQAIQVLIADGVPGTSIVRIAADGWEAKELRTVAQNTALPRLPEGTIRYWFFDEITAVTGDWATQIKWLRDNDPAFRSATVVLTGSNAATLTAASGVLAGRRGQVSRRDKTLPPMGFRSFARLLDPELPDAPPISLSGMRGRTARDGFNDLLPWIDNLADQFETYLSHGGFPVAVAAAKDGDTVPPSFVDDIFNVVFKDAFINSQLSASKTAALLERIMAGISAPISMNGIGDELDISHELVRRHIGYLRDGYLIWACPQRAAELWLPREKAQDKIYAIDPIIARLAHLRNNHRRDIDVTALAEMQIGTAVRRRALADGAAWEDDNSLFYARTPTRKEIDFVAEVFAGVALEGKYTESGRWAREAATVDASAWRGVMVTRSVLDTASSDSAWAVPAGMLAYLLDT
ncbi:MAG: AAA family ATPase [Actinomycetes bacterium]